MIRRLSIAAYALSIGSFRAWIVVTVVVVYSGGCQSQVVRVERGQPQLFVDDLLIESQSDLQRTLHQPRKDDEGDKPIISLEGHTTLLAKGTILFDARLAKYVMFAKAKPSTDIYRFTSTDGLTWTAGDDGRPERIMVDRVNPATGKLEGYAGMHSFFFDTRDPAYPYKAWIFFGNWGNEHEGIYYLRSRDGKMWERGAMIADGYAGPGDPTCRVIRQDGRVIYGPGDTSRFAYDPVEDRFLGILKFFTMDRVGPNNGLRSRAYLFVERLDARIDVKQLDKVALLPPAAMFNGDMPSDEYYATSAWRYGSHWLGGLLVWHGQDNYPYSAAGCAFLKLVASHDGLCWKKIQFVNDDGVPEVFIPNGREGGNGGRNDGGYMSEFSQGPLRIGDELVYYYGCSSYGKNHPQPTRVSGGGIFRARLRVDGFVSVDAGMVTTRRLAFDGDDLSLNAIGPVRVEVLNDGGKVEGATEVAGDSIRHDVRFAGNSLRDLRPEGRARLRFTVLPGGRLFAVRID